MGTDLPPVDGEASLPVEPTDAATEGSMSILPVGDLSTAVELAGEATGPLDLESPVATPTDVPAAEATEATEAVPVAEEVAAPSDAAY